MLRSLFGRSQEKLHQADILEDQSITLNKGVEGAIVTIHGQGRGHENIIAQLVVLTMKEMQEDLGLVQDLL